MRHAVTFATGLVAVGLLSSGAAAETPAPDASSAGAAPSSGSDKGAAAVAEVVVTAQKRVQAVEGVGASLQALSGQELAQQHVEQLADVANLVPGLTLENRSGDETPTFAVRGIGLDDFNPANNSSTAVYIDGAYQTSPVFLSQPIYDINRVEVLKGPQGTLYGRNATGGVVSIVSNAPTNDLQGTFTGGFSRWNTFDAAGAVSGPLGAGFTGRIAGTITNQGEGWQRDVDTGRRYGRTERYAGRAILEYDTGALKIVANIHAYHDGSTPSSYQADMSSVEPAIFDTNSTSASAVKVGNLSLYRNETQVGGNLLLSIDLGPADLETVLSYDSLRRINVDNNDGEPAAVYNYFFHENITQAYEETRLVSKAAVFGIVDWIVGTSYSLQRFKSRDSSDQTTSLIGLYEDPVDLTSTGESVAQANVVERPSSVDGFFQTTSHLTQYLRLIAGARYSADRVRADGQTTETGSDDGGVLFQGVGSPIVILHQARNSTIFSYKAGLEYDVARHMLAYGAVSTGGKAGEYFIAPALDPAQWLYVEPERVTSYEVGLRSDLFARRLQFNAAAFYYDYVDRQSSVLFQSPITGGIAASIANLPKSRIEGFEADATARPFEGLTMNGAFTHLNSRVAQTIQDVNGAPLLQNIPVGAQLAQAPKWSYTLRIEYRWRLAQNLPASGELSYSWSGVQLNAIDDPFGAVGANSDRDGKASIFPTGRLRLSLWGKNLTNNNDITAANVDFIEGRTLFRRKPISGGVEAGYQF